MVVMVREVMVMVEVGVGSVSSESSIHCLVVLGISTCLRERERAILYFPLTFSPPSLPPISPPSPLSSVWLYLPPHS